MSRAPRMSPEERRKALVGATLPLLLDHGAAVSTRQIAEAAGVAEGTIFRVFASKADLIHACVIDAITEDALRQRLAALPPDGDLAADVSATVRILAERIAAIRTLVTLLHDQSGVFGARSPHTRAPADDRCERPDPQAVHAAVHAAVASVLARHADALRLPVDAAASTLIALTFGATHAFAGGEQVPDAAALTDVLLSGISKET